MLRKKTSTATIYDRLLAEGYTDEELRQAAEDANKRLSVREFSIALADTEDGTPIVGIQYRCDYRAEEEYGVRDLQKAFGVPEGPEGWTMGGKKYASHVSKFTGLPEGAFGFVLSLSNVQSETEWAASVHPSTGPTSWPVLRSAKDLLASRDDLKPWQVSDNYDKWWEEHVAWAQEMSTRTTINRYTTVKELKEIGARLGITKFKRAKADILAQIHEADSALTPNKWPGWFHYGKEFVLRADSGIVADVLEMLHEAAVEGTLSFGGGAQVFGSGLSIYDGRDVGPKLTKERKDHARWYKKAMKALEPVDAELTKRGYTRFSLSTPNDGFKSKQDYGTGEVVQTNPKDIYYWLNMSGVGPRKNRQAYGWYTAKELLDEKFVADVEAKAARE